jgi:hypothetical protein
MLFRIKSSYLHYDFGIPALIEVKTHRTLNNTLGSYELCSSDALVINLCLKPITLHGGNIMWYMRAVYIFHSADFFLLAVTMIKSHGQVISGARSVILSQARVAQM